MLKAPGQREIIRVRTVSVDGFTTERRLKPDFLKIDVEGAELRVFEGARKTLAGHGPDILFEISPRRTSPRDILLLLRSCGYNRFWTFCPQGLKADDQLALSEGRNTINYVTSRRPSSLSLIEQWERRGR